MSHLTSTPSKSAAPLSAMLHRAQPCPVHEIGVPSFLGASNQIITRNDWDEFRVMSGVRLTNITPHCDSNPLHHFRVRRAAQGPAMPRTRNGHAIFPCHLKPNHHTKVIRTNSESGAGCGCRTSHLTSTRSQSAAFVSPVLHRAQPCTVHEMVVQSFPGASNQIIMPVMRK
jgi:hypothetical protein